MLAYYLVYHLTLYTDNKKVIVTYLHPSSFASSKVNCGINTNTIILIGMYIKTQDQLTSNNPSYEYSSRSSCKRICSLYFRRRLVACN